MKYNEQEIQFLKDEITKWKLVIPNEKSKNIINNDVELALEIISLEKE